MVTRGAPATVGTGRDAISPLGWALRGAAAGAVGTSALNTVTYLDMVVRGRASSSTPEDTVEKLAATAHVPIPGEGEIREHRVQGLGLLLGLAAGVGVGVLTGLVRAAGLRSSPPIGALLTASAAMLVGNGPMTVLGITDPRSWTSTDWLSDVLPHLAYGVVVKTTMDAFD
jgi:hypothetical protein